LLATPLRTNLTCSIMVRQTRYGWYNPLPLDLPTVKKDLLLLMAAYDGSIDRYVRLCRPSVTSIEVPCVIRGICHHTMFARWWSTGIERVPSDSRTTKTLVYKLAVL
jgi:hypothetical protein